jgi:hypothetical protein
MKIADYNTHGFDFLREPRKQYLTIKTTPTTIDCFELIRQTERAVIVSLASRPELYTGQEQFALPKSAFKAFDSMDEVLELKMWFVNMMDRQTKKNMNLIF